MNIIITQKHVLSHKNTIKLLKCKQQYNDWPSALKLMIEKRFI